MDLRYVWDLIFSKYVLSSSLFLKEKEAKTMVGEDIALHSRLESHLKEHGTGILEWGIETELWEICLTLTETLKSLCCKHRKLSVFRSVILLLISSSYILIQVIFIDIGLFCSVSPLVGLKDLKKTYQCAPLFEFQHPAYFAPEYDAMWETPTDVRTIVKKIPLGLLKSNW